MEPVLAVEQAITTPFKHLELIVEPFYKASVDPGDKEGGELAVHNPLLPPPFSTKMEEEKPSVFLNTWVKSTAIHHNIGKDSHPPQIHPNLRRDGSGIKAPDYAALPA